MAYVQSDNNWTTSGNLTLTLTSVASGATLVVAAGTNNEARTFTISDDQANTWNTLWGPTDHTNDDLRIYGWAAYNVSAATTVITITPDSGTPNTSGVAAEFSGRATSAAVEASSVKEETSITTSHTGTAVTSTSGADLFSGIFVDGTTGATPGDGTEREEYSANTPSAYLQTENNVGAGSQNTGTITTPGSERSLVYLVSIKSASGDANLSAGAQVVAVSAPTASVLGGDASLSANAQTVAVSAPTATLSAGGAGPQTLTPSAAVVSISSPSASISAPGVSYVQSASSEVSSSNSTWVTLSDVTQGSAIVVFAVISSESTTPSIGDGKNRYVDLRGQFDHSSTTMRGRMWVASNVDAGDTTITMSVNAGTTADLRLIAAEYSGRALNAAGESDDITENTSTVNHGFGNVVSTDGAVVVGALVTGGTIGGTTPSIGFTERIDTSRRYLQDDESISAGTVIPSTVTLGTARTGFGMVVSLRSAADEAASQVEWDFNDIEPRVYMTFHTEKWADAVNNDAPVGWWRLRGDNTDETANANNATGAGTPGGGADIDVSFIATEYLSALQVGARFFNGLGTGDRLEVTDDAVLDFGSGDFTIEIAGFQPSSGSESGDGTVLHKRAAAGSGAGYEVNYDYDNTTLEFTVHDGTDSATASWVQDLDDNRFPRHLLCVSDGNTIRLIVDGTEQATDDRTLVGNINNAGDLIFGSAGGTTNDFRGYVDEIALYGSALSTARRDVHVRAAVWQDVSSDVRVAGNGLRWGQGIRGFGPLSRVASPGTATFILDNTDQNSGGVEGYYSPDGVNIRTGFGLQSRVMIGLYLPSTDAERIYWAGDVTEINVATGKKGTRAVRVTAKDYFYLLSKKKVVIPPLTDTTALNAYDQVLAAMDHYPQNMSVLDSTPTNEDSWPLALDDASKGGSIPALQILQRIAQSDVGFIFNRGVSATPLSEPSHVFQRRLERERESGLSSSFFDQMSRAELVRGRATVFNRVLTSTVPKRRDTSLVNVYELRSSDASDETAVHIGPGESLDLICEFTDPNDRKTRIAADNLQTPVAITDYTFTKRQDGTGTDLTENLTVTLSETGAQSVKATLTNNGTTGYLRTFDIRGNGIYTEQRVTYENESTDPALLLIDENLLSYVVQYSTDQPEFADNVGQHLLHLYAEHQTNVRSITFLANRSDLSFFFTFTAIGDRIEVTETMSGIANQYYIQSIDVEALPQSDTSMLLWVTYGLAPARYGYWSIGTPGHSEIGVSTRLGL